MYFDTDVFRLEGIAIAISMHVFSCLSLIMMSGLLAYYYCYFDVRFISLLLLLLLTLIEMAVLHDQ